MKKLAALALITGVLIASIVSCTKYAAPTLYYKVVTPGDSVLDNIYVPDTGVYNLQVETKFLTGSPTEAVQLWVTGMPANATVSPDTITAIPTFTASFAIHTNFLAHGTYPLTLYVKSVSTGIKSYPFSMIVAAPDCATALLGTLTGGNTCTARNYVFTATATSSGPGTIDVVNFGGYGSNTSTHIILNCDNHTLVISNANNDIGNGTKVTGSGTFTTTSMTINYTANITTSAFSETCQLTMSK